MPEAQRSRIGVMGGTFDPIHHGHLFAAEEVRHAFELERVLFVPVGDPWQKADTAVSPADDRLEMVRLATEDNDAFEVSRVDVDRSGPTYTIDTLRALATERPGAEVFFITGADAILEILTWKDPQEALRLATFVAVTRPGHDLAGLRQLGIEERVVILEMPALAISSTEIRSRVAEGRPVRYLVPAPVERYIRERHLYEA
jgi:nicotinate-nucleotide adenylyltransferase